jgi:hypothetical protein
MHCSKIIKAFRFLFALGRNGCFKRSNDYTILTSKGVFPNVRRGLDYMGSQAFIKFCKCCTWNKPEEAPQMVNELTVNEEIIAIYLTNGYKFYFSNLKTVILQELIFLCTSTKFNDRREGKEYIINIKKSVTTSGFIK